MKISRCLVLASTLLGLSSPLWAFTLQCKTIKGTQVQQCVSKGKGASKLYGLTNMPYALCSKALCTIDKKHPSKAQCSCDLYQGSDWQSLSISPTSYNKTKPKYAANKTLVGVQSNYSMANLTPGVKTNNITCQFKSAKPWANCFGAPCTVKNGTTAMCSCPVVKSKSFSITGPGDVQKCVTQPHQIWSAIAVKEASGNSNFVGALYQKTFPDSPIVTSGS